MNKVILMGRLTKDPEVRFATRGDGQLAIARYTLAVDRRRRQDGESSADFINCVVFDRGAEFAERYLRKGMKILVTGRIQTGSYTNQQGNKVYTTDVAVEEQEFCESKNAGTTTPAANTRQAEPNDGFMNIPDDVEDSGLPFN